MRSHGADDAADEYIQREPEKDERCDLLEINVNTAIVFFALAGQWRIYRSPMTGKALYEGLRIESIEPMLRLSDRTLSPIEFAGVQTMETAAKRVLNSE